MTATTTMLCEMYTSGDLERDELLLAVQNMKLPEHEIVFVQKMLQEARCAAAQMLQQEGAVAL